MVVKEPAMRELRPREHVAEHFFKGVCVCPCGRCTTTIGGETICICHECLPATCGMKKEGKVA